MLAGTQLLIEFQNTALVIVGSILLEACFEFLLIAEQFTDLFVGAYAERTNENGDRNLTVSIYTNLKNVVGIGFIFKPCTAVRDNGTSI